MGKGMKMSRFLKSLSDFFFTYETPRQVVVRNIKVGVACRLIQVGVFAYIIGWVFIYEKGYQSKEYGVSSVFTKVKGVGYTKGGKHSESVWDVADYVFPPQGEPSFVVMTNYIETEGQKRGTCPEVCYSFTHELFFMIMTRNQCRRRHRLLAPFWKKLTSFPYFQQLPRKSNCSSDADCKKGSFKRRLTGECDPVKKTCRVLAWCPVEDDRIIPDPPLLMSAENFTVFIKNTVTFPFFGVTRSNLVDDGPNTKLSKCLYHKTHAPLCPIFRLGDLIEQSGFDFEIIARIGGAIGVVIEWSCNFDFDVKYCIPVYSFHGLYGNLEEKNKNRESVGYNFRHAIYYMAGKEQRRTLRKIFGIRIDIIVEALGRKFDVIPTLTAIGSGVGIFGVVTIVCDLVLLNLLPKRKFYKDMKFKSASPVNGQQDHGQDQGQAQVQDLDSEGCSAETEESKSKQFPERHKVNLKNRGTTAELLKNMNKAEVLQVAKMHYEMRPNLQSQVLHASMD
ncbi:P2X purinoceptor 1-like isoform 2-T2 [Syngnathus typhle]